MTANIVGREKRKEKGQWQTGGFVIKLTWWRVAVLPKMEATGALMKVLDCSLESTLLLRWGLDFMGLVANIVIEFGCVL